MVVRDRFMAQMVRFNAAFEEKFTLNEAKMDIFYERLMDMDEEYFVKTVDAILDTSEYAPTIATIRKKYDELYSEWVEHVAKMHDIFDSTCSRWPDISYEDKMGARETWDRLVFEKRDDHASHIERANWILKRASEAIRKFEEDAKAEGISKFDSWMEGLENYIKERKKRQTAQEA